MRKRLPILLCSLIFITSCTPSTPTQKIESIDIVGVNENEMVEQGSVLNLRATTNPSNALVKWETSNPHIASIDEFGILKLHGVGKVNIIAQGGGKKDEVTIQVYPNVEIILDTLKNDLSIEGRIDILNTTRTYHFEKVVDKSENGQYFSFCSASLGDDFDPYVVVEHEFYFKDENGLLVHNYINNNNEVVNVPVDGSYFDDAIKSPFDNVTSNMIEVISLDEVMIRFDENFIDYNTLLAHLVGKDDLNIPVDGLYITLKEDGSLDTLNGVSNKFQLRFCHFVPKYYTAAPKRKIIPNEEIEEKEHASQIVEAIANKNYTVDISIGTNEAERYVMYVDEKGIALVGENVTHLEVYSYQDGLGLFAVDVDNDTLIAKSDNPVALDVQSFNPIHFDNSLITYPDSEDKISLLGGLDPFVHRLVGLDPTYPLLEGKLDVRDISSVFLNTSYDENDNIDEIYFDMLVMKNIVGDYVYQKATLLVRNIGTTTFPYSGYEFVPLAI